MKKSMIFTTGFNVLLFCQISIGQALLDFQAQMFLQEWAELHDNRQPDINFLDRHDIRYIDGELFINTAVVCSESFNLNNVLTLGAMPGSVVGQVRTFQVPLRSIEKFMALPDFTQLSISNVFQPLLNKSLPSARVDSVHAGYNLPQAYKGKDVIVAILDIGFDFTHPAFLDSTLTSSRIIGVWNQADPTLNPPSGYFYGSYYSSQAAIQQRGRDYDNQFHGTFVAAIAAGNSVETPYNGVAPSADLLLVSMRNFSAASIIDALTFASNTATKAGKPIVLNMSFGTYQGPKDGTSLWDKVLNELSGQGRIFVVSAGNSGNDLTHIHHSFDADTITTFVNFHPDNQVPEQNVIMWSNDLNDFSYQLSLVSHENEELFKTPFITSFPNSTYSSNLGSSGNFIFVQAGTISGMSSSGKHGSFLRIGREGDHRVLLRITASKATVHAWNQTLIGSSLGSWSFSGEFPATKGGDNDFTITDPAANPSVIAVGSYKAESQALYGAISPFSSLGPTVDLRTKPDITSVGEDVISAVNSFHKEVMELDNILLMEFNGKQYGYFKASGTSFSSPMVTGIVALMLEANPQLSASEAKEILKATARLDHHTGQIDNNGINTWGWGKANALAAVQASLRLVNTQNISISSELLTVFPNPGYDEIVVKIPKGLNSNSNVSITFSDMNGQIVHSIQTQSTEDSFRLDISTLPAGLYLINAIANNRMYLGKLVKI